MIGINQGVENGPGYDRKTPQLCGRIPADLIKIPGGGGKDHLSLRGYGHPNEGVKSMANTKVSKLQRSQFLVLIPIIL